MAFFSSLLSGGDTRGGLKPIVLRTPASPAPPRSPAIVVPKPALAAPTRLELAPLPPAPKAPEPSATLAPLRRAVVLPKPAPKAPEPSATLAPLRRAVVLPKPAPVAPTRIEPAPPPPAPKAPEPSAALAPLRRAVVLQARGNHEAAVAEFTQALELDPGCVEAWSGRGISREQLGDLPGAKSDYTRSIRIEIQAEIDRQCRAQ